MLKEIRSFGKAMGGISKIFIDDYNDLSFITVKGPNQVKRFSIVIDFDWDWKFFAILPALNVNMHSKQLEFEWLFLGIYIRKNG